MKTNAISIVPQPVKMKKIAVESTKKQSHQLNKKRKQLTGFIVTSVVAGCICIVRA